MTELGNGVYKAIVPLGTMWKVYDNATPPGVDTTFTIEAGYGMTREPAINPGTPTHVFTGGKVWTMLSKGMVIGLNESLTAIEYEAAQVASAEATERARGDTILSERIDTLEEGGAKSTAAIGSMTCSKRNISIRKTVLFPADASQYGKGFVVASGFGGAVSPDGNWMDIATLRGDLPVDEDFGVDLAVLSRSPFPNILVPGVVPEFGVEFIHTSLPETGGMLNTSLCDFRFAIARVGINGTVGAYSEWSTPSHQSALRLAETGGWGIYRAFCSLAAPLEISDPGGFFSIKAQAKVKTAGSAVSLGLWHHANVDIILFPKVA